MADDASEKRPRTEGSMPPELREKIETALAAVGEVEYQRRSHRRKCPLFAKVLSDADLVHERGEIVRNNLGLYCIISALRSCIS